MTIAERRLYYCRRDELDKVEVVVAVRAIVPASDLPGLFKCEIETSLGDKRTQDVYGEDSIQALALGLLGIVNFLRDLDASGALSWQDGTNYEFGQEFMFFLPLDQIAQNLGISG